MPSVFDSLKIFNSIEIISSLIHSIVYKKKTQIIFNREREKKERIKYCHCFAIDPIGKKRSCEYLVRDSQDKTIKISKEQQRSFIPISLKKKKSPFNMSVVENLIALVVLL